MEKQKNIYSSNQGVADVSMDSYALRSLSHIPPMTRVILSM